MRNPRYDRQYDITHLQWRHALSVITPRGTLEYMFVSDEPDIPVSLFRIHMESALLQFRQLLEDE